MPAMTIRHRWTRRPRSSTLQERGQDVSQMTETEILTANTGAKVFIASHVKFVDAMEDLQMTVNM